LKHVIKQQNNIIANHMAPMWSTMFTYSNKNIESANKVH